MAKKSSKKTAKPVRPQLGEGVEILNAGSVLEDPITRTLETNYMPYAMSVIVSRALPEIDGFKPAHRKPETPRKRPSTRPEPASTTKKATKPRPVY